MKTIIALGFGLALSQAALAQDAAKVLPALPGDCLEQIADNGLYCKGQAISGDKVTVTFAAVVSKEVFPDVDSLLNRYLNFGSWPTFVDNSPQKVIEFKSNGSKMLDTIVDQDGQTTIYRHVYEYSMKVQGIPLLKQPVHGITYNKLVAPYEGSLASLEFAAQTGPVDGFPQKPKGVKSQVGSLHALECTGLEVCDDSKWLLIYETVAQPDISFAMGIAANTVSAGIEDLLVGLLDVSAE